MRGRRAPWTDEGRARLRAAMRELYRSARTYHRLGALVGASERVIGAVLCGETACSEDVARRLAITLGPRLEDILSGAWCPIARAA